MVKRAGGVLLNSLSVDRGRSVPLSRQIYEAIRNSILEGRIAPGTRLPSTRVLAQDLGVSRTTIRQCFDQLIDEGYLVGRVGHGSFVPRDLPHQDARPVKQQVQRRSRRKSPAPQLSQRGQALASAVVFGGRTAQAFDPGIPAFDLFPSALWARLAGRRWRHQSDDLMGYGEPGGYRPLREALASYLSSMRGLQCNADQVIITAGVLHSLGFIARLLLDPGDRVWMEEPGYASGRGAFSAIGAKVAPVLYDDEGFDLARACRDESRARLAYVCPSRHYPLGMTMPLTRRLELLSWAAESGSWILENDADAEFRYSGPPLPAMQGLDRAETVLYLGTFSKTLYPGLRLSYLVVPPSLAEPFARAQHVEMPIPTGPQAVAADFINEGHFTTHIRHMREAYQEREAVLTDALVQHAGGLLDPEPTGSGFHMKVDLTSEINEEAVSQAAAAAGLIAYGLASYYQASVAADTRYAPGLVLGFACLPPERIERHVVELVRAVEGVGTAAAQ